MTNGLLEPTGQRWLARALGGSIAVLGCVLALCALSVAQAAAAPQLEVASSHTPGMFVPGGTGEYRISVRNVGDAPTSAPVELVVSLPAGVAAVSAADTSGFGIWPCSISPDGGTVTCEGPALVPHIPAGSDACQAFLGNACPIAIDVEIDAEAEKGTFSTEVEACGGGAADCAEVSDATAIFNFGDRYGFAPINAAAGATDSVPALPGETHAFWAGACDRASAPAFGDLIVGGIGSRPPSIEVPIFDSSAIPNSTYASRPAPAVAPHCIDWGTMAHYRTGGALDLWRRESSWRLAPQAAAGAHPDGSTTMMLARNEDGVIDGATDNIYVDLPAGFVGDPSAVPKCTAEQFAVEPPSCGPQTQVGTIHLVLAATATGQNPNLLWAHEEVLPVYNIEPRRGNVAELGFAYASVEDAATVRLVAKARTNGDFGVTAFAAQIPSALPFIGQSITLWGVPWAESNDTWRASEGVTGVPPEGLGAAGVPYDPDWGPIRPFLSNPTECSGQQLHTRVSTDQYLHPGAFTAAGDPDLSDPDWKTQTSPAPPVTGCEKPPFAPDIELAPTTSAADAPSGLSAQLSIPQNDDPPAAMANNSDDRTGAPAHWRHPDGRGFATAQLEGARVTLPAGVAVNPAGAAGLAACADAQIGVTDASSNPVLFNNEDPFDDKGAECPDASKIGAVQVDTPLLDEPLTGEVVLGMPKSTDPMSGDMFRLFIVVRSVERGLVAKIFGSTVADPATGQLTATFERNPRVPFEQMRLHFKGGPRGTLATPQRCGNSGWSARFSPWTAMHGAGGQAVPDAGAFATDSNCAFGFSPRAALDMAGRQGRASGTFSFELTRNDGEQWFSGITARMPRGLLAAVGDVPLCTNAQAAADACPAASKIGIADAGAGAGAPYFLERKGSVYLTESYKGGAYGLSVSVPVEAGPFRGPLALDTIVVRQALHVDPKTADVTAISDPLPQIHHGIPLRVRKIIVRINRPGFMVNASDCSPKQLQATITSTTGATATPAAPYQATGCDRLDFEPKLRLRLTGRRQLHTGRHPGVRALVTQSPTEAGIEHAKVALPKSFALDPANAQALCEFEDGTKPDLENHCPKGSIVGRARAITPLLDRPLRGPVFFVKNVRIDPDTGNEIRALPMIVAALRGEIAINLYGESSVTKQGKLVNTFANVPDAPINRFAMRIKGGRAGILTVTRTRRRAVINVCRRRQIAIALMDAHNNKRHDRRVRIGTPCKTRKRARRCNTRNQRQTKTCKRRAAKRRAAKNRADRKRNTTSRSSSTTTAHR